MGRATLAPERGPEPDATGIVPPRTSGHRRDDVQGLRAVAVIMVVAFHAGLAVPGGFTGVDVFFVISGFVITAMLLRELDRTERLSFGEFYSRRVRRILPASALTISVVAILSIGAIGVVAQKTAARTGAAGAVFASNFVLARQRTGYFDVKLTSNPLLHIWSLSVEEQLYFVFPAILLGGYLLARRRRGGAERTSLALVVGVLAVASFALSLYLTNQSFSLVSGGLLARIFPARATQSGAQLAFYLPFTRAWEFAVGALLAIGAPALERIGRSVAIALGAIGVLLVGLAAFAIDGTTPFPGTAVLLPVLGAACLIAAGSASRNPVSRGLGLRPLTAVGDLSYSWYLWHWPLIVFASALFPGTRGVAVTAAVISLLPAWLSYRFVETPIRHDERVRGRRALGLAAVCVVVPIACCAILWMAPHPSASTATRAYFAAQNRPHITEARKCNRGVPLGALAARCTWTTPDAKGRVVLLGDSNAGHFTEPAKRAALRHGYDFTVDSLPECPIVDLLVDKPLRLKHTPLCRKFVAKSLDDVVRAKPDLVMLAASVPTYFTDETRFRDPTTGRTATTPAAKARMWTGGLERVLQRLDRAGIPTVVLRTVPQWDDWDARSCAAVRVYLAPRTCGADQSRAEADRFLRPAVVAEDRALAKVPRATAVDFRPELCRDGHCPTNRGNVWLYKDGRHLSVQGAQQLRARFDEIVASDAGR